MSLIAPVLKDDDLLADIEQAEDDEGVFHLWWLGQSGFLLKWQGNHLLLDPYLSDSLTDKYADTDKPHVRMTERVIEPGKLKMIDVVTSSHNHTDHLDGETLIPLALANRGLQMVLPEANIAFARQRLGGNSPEMLGLDDGKLVRAGAFSFVGIPAAHNEVERDDKALCKFLGYVVKFGDFGVYHSGDTLWHRDLVRDIARHPIDLALVPINGNKPERKVAGNLKRPGSSRGGKSLRGQHGDPASF